MLFSVIIPIYNAERTLRRCLDSLLPQANGRAELILVNDGSSDGSEQICLEYQRTFPEIRYISKKNGGVSSARNAGIDAASGDYVTFVDSDDYVSPDYFSALSDYPEADFLFFSAETEKNGVQIDRITGGPLSAAPDYPAYVRAFIDLRNGSPWNKRFRLSIIQVGGIRFPADLHMGEDFVFCLRYLMVAGSCAVLDRVLYHQDESSTTSLTKRFNKNATQQALRNYALSIEAVQSAALPAAQKEDVLRLLDFNRCRTAFACAMEYFKTDRTGYRELRPKINEVLTAFGQGSSSAVPLNLPHRIMKLCVTKQWTLPVYIIAKRRYAHKISTLGD